MDAYRIKRTKDEFFPLRLAAGISKESLEKYFGSVEALEGGEVLRLDPGGMEWLKDPIINFSIDGYNFSSRATKVGLNKLLLEQYRNNERHPGMYRIPQFIGALYLTKDLVKKLIKKLKELEISDEVLNAHLDWEKQFSEIQEKTGGVFVRGIPKENG